MYFQLKTKKKEVKEQLKTFREELGILNKFGRLDHSQFYRNFYEETIFKNPLYSFGLMKPPNSPRQVQNSGQRKSRSVPLNRLSSQELQSTIKKKFHKREPQHKNRTKSYSKTLKKNRLGEDNSKFESEENKNINSRFRSRSAQEKAKKNENSFGRDPKFDSTVKKGQVRKSKVKGERFAEENTHKQSFHETLFAGNQKELCQMLKEKNRKIGEIQRETKVQSQSERTLSTEAEGRNDLGLKQQRNKMAVELFSPMLAQKSEAYKKYLLDKRGIYPRFKKGEVPFRKKNKTEKLYKKMKQNRKK